MTLRPAWISAAFAAVLVAGCASGPAPQAPSAPAAASGPFVGAADVGAVGAGAPAAWWRLFDDPALDAHVTRALAANADLRVAIANLEAAGAAARQADAARLPATVIESGVGPDRADRQPSTSSVPKTSYELGGAVAYEVDLFGRLRSASQAARADAEASAAARDAARLAVIADTVAAYLDLCGATASLRLAEAQVANQQRSYELVADQLGAGEVSPLELAQAAVLRDAAQTALPPFAADRRRALFRLATLQGKPPAEAAALDTGCARVPGIATPLPLGDGAALIARRPDIREAERRLAAATARIGVATADLYPRIQLGGSGGLIAGGSDAFLTPLITWVFPNRSAIRARIGAERGNADAALANWDRVMLRALQEVETALSDVRAERDRRAALATSLAEAERVVRRAQSRQRLGADSYLIVVDAERTRNDIASQLLAADLRLLQAQVALFRALGGGWEPAAIRLAGVGDESGPTRVILG
jgi:NodT family efflux transporter outer membrane factor (OMF) lipoprotein